MDVVLWYKCIYMYNSIHIPVLLNGFQQLPHKAVCFITYQLNIEPQL
jgi:hypothetical protein